MLQPPAPRLEWHLVRTGHDIEAEVPAGLVDGGESLAEPEIERPAVRVYDTADTVQPRIALLGNLPYTIMISNRGSGYSRYEGIAVP